MPGTLFVVATPIGNLEDLSTRALRILREAAVIAAEDTRVTRGLLSHFGVHTPLTSYHSHSSGSRTEALLERLLGGDDVALVSDAGTPGISDPGGFLVRRAVESGVPVVPVPGPSALAAVLSASGLDPSRFLFEGFLPRSRGEQRKTLIALRSLPHTLVFYEAPGRVADTLVILREVLGNREAVVAREVTKKFEEFARGRLEALAERFTASAPRGECVIVVAGALPGEPAPDVDPGPDAEGLLRSLLAEGTSVRDAARAAAERLHRSRREMYSLAQALSAEFRPEEAGLEES